MKKLIITIVFLITSAFTIPAHSAGLSKNDMKILNLLLFATIDYEQSITMFYKQSGRVELNPLLSDNPSRESMALFGAAGIITTYGISKFMDEGLLKDVLIDSILMTEKLNIEENKHTIRYGHRTFNTIMLVVNFKF